MYILGMESSCDETSAAVVCAENGRLEIVSNIVASQIETHRLYGGVVPEIASRAHIEAITGVTTEALSQAGITLPEVSAVAVTAFPGLIGALLVGVNFAKSLAYANSIPLVAVNHIKAHVAAVYLREDAPEAPFLALVVSGGHTSLFDVTAPTDFREIGATRDDAAGEAFDKIGRVIGLPYPGGAALDRLAATGDKHAIKLPSPALGADTLDLSFSGLKTAALNYINHCNQQNIPVPRADLAASFTEAVVGGIAKKVEAALLKTGRKTLVMAGGVAANSHLRARLGALCKRLGVTFAVPPLSLCGDNGAMVAAAGFFEYQNGNFATPALNASAQDLPAL
ncbi:MAG: tRNA (adenosine(37)-N6)-threonylcarbamoyltransferase complex transferase subunit TsaD [Ruminococcaceae bacterium]|nr:tRNA (adenosine(37)-N6)-threonylcarbamoyltransferase complex transferase subunit TsaD [Oscillospiraceae bacterium]